MQPRSVMLVNHKPLSHKFARINNPGICSFVTLPFFNLISQMTVYSKSSRFLNSSFFAIRFASPGIVFERRR